MYQRPKTHHLCLGPLSYYDSYIVIPIICSSCTCHSSWSRIRCTPLHSLYPSLIVEPVGCHMTHNRSTIFSSNLASCYVELCVEHSLSISVRFPILLYDCIILSYYSTLLHPFRYVRTIPFPFRTSVYIRLFLSTFIRKSGEIRYSNMSFMNLSQYCHQEKPHLLI